MSAQQAYRKIDRNEVYNHIKSMILANPRKETEVSASDLADRFGVQAPTMDYHLSKMLEEGMLDLSENRGRYNRKIYLLPEEVMKAELKEEQTVNPQDLIFNDPEAFKELLLNKIEEQKIDETNVAQQQEVEAEQHPFEAEEKTTPPDADTDSQTLHKPEEDFFQQPTEKEYQELEVKDLTLDDRIEMFLQQSKNVRTADQLLTRQDREILSVMNESIQEQMVYFKDLTEQLSTTENKQLIQHLIDERNDMKDQVDRMKAEQELLIEQNKASESKNASIDPARVRQMHQIIISTLDNYLDQPNHSLALGRHEFRNNMTKEISDLAKYVLNLVD